MDEFYNVPRIAENLTTLLDNLNNTTKQINELMSPENKAHLEKVFTNADIGCQCRIAALKLKTSSVER